MPATYAQEQHDSTLSTRALASNNGVNDTTAYASHNGQAASPTVPTKIPEAAAAALSKMMLPAAATPGVHVNKGNAAPLPMDAPSSASPAGNSRSMAPDDILAPFMQSSKAAFAKALSDDQRAALQPDYQAAFTSANDVVRRLLPYHVFQISESDLRYAMRETEDEQRGDTDAKAKEEAGIAGIEDRGEGSSKGTTALQRNRKRRQSEVMQDDEEMLLRYPSVSTTNRLWSRYVEIKERASKLQQRLMGDVAKEDIRPAPFAEEMLIHLLRLARDQDREEAAIASEKLRTAKDQAIAAGFRWDDLVRVGAIERSANPFLPGPSASAAATPSAAVPTPSSATPTTATPQSQNGNLAGHQSSPQVRPNPQSQFSTTQQGATYTSPYTPTPPPMKISKPRGRPRKDRSGQNMVPPPPRNAHATPPTQYPHHASMQAHRPPMASSPNRPPTHRPPFPPSTPRPAGAAASSPSSAVSHGRPSSAAASPTSSPATSRPTTTPVPLVLPLSTLNRLSELGIAPVPAPHLLPAITAQQAYAAAVASGKKPPPPPVGGNSTAPRTAPVNQTEPALLMGITEAPLSAAQKASLPAGSTSTVQQMLHVSVVLNKLNPRQLSGLAALMQSLQQQQQQHQQPAPSPSAGAGAGAAAAATAAGGTSSLPSTSSVSSPIRPPPSTTATAAAVPANAATAAAMATLQTDTTQNNAARPSPLSSTTALPSPSTSATLASHSSINNNNHIGSSNSNNNNSSNNN